MSRSTAHDARNAALQSTFSSLDGARAQSIPDAIVIPARAKILGLAHCVEDIPESDGAKIHWVGDRSATKVILYFHGGGYGLSAFDGHVIFLDQCTERLNSVGHKTVVAFLEYGLTKVKKYPTQFIQATEGLRWVLAKGYKPSNIIVGGDSCGGNMVTGLISHILHPLEGLKPLKLEESLAGLLLISAWVSFRSDSMAYVRNGTKDIHMKRQMHEWAHDFALESERNNWSEPLLAEFSWWKDAPARKILNIWGDFEIFQDDIALFGQNLVKAGLNVENVECPLQVHIDCVLDAQSGMEVGLMSTATWKWLETVF